MRSDKTFISITYPVAGSTSPITFTINSYSTLSAGASTGNIRLGTATDTVAFGASTILTSLDFTGFTGTWAQGTNGLTINNSGVFGTTLQALGGIQATRIGNVVASSGQFTTVDATGNISTLANLTVNNVGYFGINGNATNLTNPTIVATSTSQNIISGAYYVQTALLNFDGNGSADFIAYPNNYPGSGSDHGWMDVGITGNTFSDPAYTITGRNDG